MTKKWTCYTQQCPLKTYCTEAVKFELQRPQSSNCLFWTSVLQTSLQSEEWLASRFSTSVRWGCRLSSRDMSEEWGNVMYYCSIHSCANASKRPLIVQCRNVSGLHMGNIVHTEDIDCNMFRAFLVCGGLRQWSQVADWQGVVFATITSSSAKS